MKFATPLEVKENDVIITCGYRCRVSDCRLYTAPGKLPVARYRLHSEPNEKFPHRLLQAFEGMLSGGNKLARVAIET